MGEDIRGEYVFLRGPSDSKFGFSPVTKGTKYTVDVHQTPRGLKCEVTKYKTGVASGEAQNQEIEVTCTSLDGRILLGGNVKGFDTVGRLEIGLEETYMNYPPDRQSVILMGPGVSSFVFSRVTKGTKYTVDVLETPENHKCEVTKYKTGVASGDNQEIEVSCRKSTSAVPTQAPSERPCTCDQAGADYSESCRLKGNDDGCGLDGSLLLGMGDCDSDADCVGLLTCGTDACPWNDGDDCCVIDEDLERLTTHDFFCEEVKGRQRKSKESVGSQDECEEFCLNWGECTAFTFFPWLNLCFAYESCGYPLRPGTGTTVEFGRSSSRRASWKLEKIGHECKSAGQSLGKKSSVRECAEVVWGIGGKYFLFGTGPRAGMCYQEYAWDETCSRDGWQADDYNFYSLAPPPARTKGEGIFATLTKGNPLTFEDISVYSFSLVGLAAVLYGIFRLLKGKRGEEYATVADLEL